MEIQSTSGGVHMEYHTSDSDVNDQSEEESCYFLLYQNRKILYHGLCVFDIMGDKYYLRYVGEINI